MWTADYPPLPPPGQAELPYSDGEPMDSGLHGRLVALLIAILEHSWGKRDFFAGGNMFVYYEINQSRKFRGPDFFLVLDVPRHPRHSWVAWEEGGRLPDVVMEMLSPTTAAEDRGAKKTLYERVWKVPEYFLYDAEQQKLEGFRLINGRYRAIRPNKSGDLRSVILGLGLGMRPTLLAGVQASLPRWLNEDGDPLPTPEEAAAAEAQRAEMEAQRAEMEAQRATDAEARAATLAARLAAYEAKFGRLTEE